MLTAITFPLKKFPGQLRHESMIFTGRVFAQAAILSVSLTSHVLLTYLLEASYFEAALYSLPLLFPVVAHVVYLWKMKKGKLDYFNLSLTRLKLQFSEDKAYFNKVRNLGVSLSILIFAYAYLGEIITPQLLSMNSALLSLLYFTSINMGLYSKKRIMSYAIFVAVLEASIFLGWIVGSRVVLYSSIALAAMLYIRVRAKEHTLVGLLQAIIR